MYFRNILPCVYKVFENTSPKNNTSMSSSNIRIFQDDSRSCQEWWEPEFKLIRDGIKISKKYRSNYRETSWCDTQFIGQAEHVLIVVDIWDNDEDFTRRDVIIPVIDVTILQFFKFLFLKLCIEWGMWDITYLIGTNHNNRRNMIEISGRLKNLISMKNFPQLSFAIEPRILYSVE